VVHLALVLCSDHSPYSTLFRSDDACAALSAYVLHPPRPRPVLLISPPRRSSSCLLDDDVLTVLQGESRAAGAVDPDPGQVRATHVSQLHAPTSDGFQARGHLRDGRLRISCERDGEVVDAQIADRRLRQADHVCGARTHPGRDDVREVDAPDVWGALVHVPRMTVSDMGSLAVGSTRIEGVDR